MVASQIARLQLPDPVPTCNHRQGPVTGQMLFNAKLIELSAVKAAEFRRQAAEHPNQRELRSDDVNDKAKPRLLGEREAMFNFVLHVGQRLAGEEQGRVEVVARKGSRSEISDPARRFERVTQQITASPHVLRPAPDVKREPMIDPRLKAF